MKFFYIYVLDQYQCIKPYTQKASKDQSIFCNLIFKRYSLNFPVSKNHIIYVNSRTATAGWNRTMVHLSNSIACLWCWLMGRCIWACIKPSVMHWMYNIIPWGYKMNKLRLWSPELLVWHFPSTFISAKENHWQKLAQPLVKRTD